MLLILSVTMQVFEVTNAIDSIIVSVQHYDVKVHCGT